MMRVFLTSIALAILLDPSSSIFVRKRRDKLDIILENVHLGQIKALKNQATSSAKPKIVKIVLNGWAPWGEFGMCSRSCGEGRAYRRRLCLVSGIVADISFCNGSAIDHKVCEGEEGCALNGGWTQWTSWKCGVTCGPGESVRFRKCTNPVPANGGKDCEGSAVEEGKCWLVDCPDVSYAISPETQSIIDERKMKAVHSYVINSGSRGILPCDKDLSEKIYAEFPNSNTEWFKNGEKLQPDTFRAWVMDEDLIVAYAKPEDTGIYDCRVFYSRSLCVVVTVISVVVLDSTLLSVHQDDTLSIDCRCSEMSSYFPKLTRTLILNNSIYLRENESCSEDSFNLDLVSIKHNGEWRCHLVELGTGRIWTTNVVNVGVLPPKSFFDKAWDHPWIVVIVIMAWLIVTILLGGLYSWWKEPMTNEKFKKKNED